MSYVLGVVKSGAARLQPEERLDDGLLRSLAKIVILTKYHPTDGKPIVPNCRLA